MKTHSKPHQVMIGRSALLSDSLLWSSDKTGRNPCGPVAIRIRQREFGQFGIMSILSDIGKQCEPADPGDAWEGQPVVRGELP